MHYVFKLPLELNEYRNYNSENFVSFSLSLVLFLLLLFVHLLPNHARIQHRFILVRPLSFIVINNLC